MIPLPTFTNSLQLIGYVAILVYMAYGQWLTRENAKRVKERLEVTAAETKGHLDAAAKVVADKAEQVHDLVNGQNTEFKRLLTEKTGRDAEIHQQIAETAAAKASLALMEDFTERIKRLEAVIASQQKTIQAGPSITPVTADQKISEVLPP